MTVTPIGAKRRITALMYNGWSPETLAGATGLPEGMFRRLVRRQDRIRPETLSAIGAAYERLWNTAPPQRTAAERELAEAYARHGRSFWAPPMAYDDDTIDLDEGGPAAGWKRSARTTMLSADLMEDITWLREQDDYRQATPAQLAVRLGKSRGSVEQALCRGKRTAERATAS